MKKPATLLLVAALGAIIMASPVRAQEQDAGPIKITRCQTISQPGSYKLADNLTFTSISGTCLSITASNVTIDLAGFSISGPDYEIVEGPTATAIAAGDNTIGITVRNGSISGFGTGVGLSGSGSIVEGLNVSRGPVVGIAATGIVKGNTVVDIVGGAGTGTGISATGIVTGNYVFDYRGVGLQIGQESTVIGNTATSQSFDQRGGIVASCPSNVTNNTASYIVLNGNGCINTNNVGALVTDPWKLLGQRGRLFIGKVERHLAEMVSAAASGKISSLNGWATVIGQLCPCLTNTRWRCAKPIKPGVKLRLKLARRATPPTSTPSADDLDFIKAQVVRIPTRKEIARLVLLGTLATEGLVLLGEMLLR